jgi:eukaryotic-like serine/threonine-protein kinase
MALQLLQPTQVIARRYQITRYLHRVGESDYYAAVDTTTQTPVTLRTINVAEVGAVGAGLEHLAADKMKRKMENEKPLLVKLVHPGLLPLIDVGFAALLYYHVYPAFDFENLHMRLAQRGCIPFRELIPILIDVADTMSFLHGIGIIHCDITPHTILLVENRAKIIEFVIANHDSPEGVAPGSPPYMSPEAIQGAKPAPTHDTWSLGVTMYYALSGVLPFGDLGIPRHEHVPRLFRAILTTNPKPITDAVNDLPPALIALIDGLLQKDPQARISSMQHVKTTLEGLV